MRSTENLDVWMKYAARDIFTLTNDLAEHKESEACTRRRCHPCSVTYDHGD